MADTIECFLKLYRQVEKKGAWHRLHWCCATCTNAFKDPTHLMLYSKVVFCFKYIYIVDQYCRVDAESLKWIWRNPRETFRAADCTTIWEALADAGNGENEHDLVRAEKLFVLPSFKVRGVRYVRQKMHDTIVISNTVIHSDFFATMTCGPVWPETTSVLLENSKSQDPLDLCARIFQMILRRMMHCIQVAGMLGKAAARVHVIELQKKCLLHEHCILFLDKGSKNKFNDLEYKNTFIIAEILPECDQQP